LESLEERVVPSVVFDPVFPKETLVGSAPFTTLHSPTIYLIFWGSGWGQGNSPGASVAATFASDAQTLISGTFFKATKEYGNIGTPVFGGTWTDTSNPPAGYTSGSGNNGNFPALQGEIASAIANNPSWAPSGLFYTQSPIYVVIPVGNSGGYNTLGTYVNGLVTDFINICSVTGGGGFANNFTMVLSHELAEDITDPTGNSGNGVTLAFSTSPNFPGFTNETTNPPGINNIAGLPGNVGYLNNSGVVQIGDGEAEPAGEAHYGYELNGVEVQGLWSAATLDKNGNPGAYIVADGNSQTVYLDPIWTNGTIPGTTPPITGPVFTGNYNLTLEGNAISVNASDGLTTATVDGQSFSFDNFGSAGGEIQNITIETVGNNATVNLLNLASDQSATIEGNGSDTVTIGSGGSSSTTSGIQGPVNITNTTLNGTTIKINDSGDVTSQQFSVNNVLGLGTVEQVGSAGILFSDADTSSLTLETGTAQNNSVFVGATAVTTNVYSNPLGLVGVHIGDVPSGGPGNCQLIQGAVNVSSLGGQAPANDLVFVDDSQDDTALAGPVTLSTFTKGTTTWGSITGLAPAAINYRYASVANLFVYTGDAPNTVDVQATGVTTLLDSDDSGTGAYPNTINVGNAGRVQGILGALNILNPNGPDTITVDDSSDTTNRSATLTNDANPIAGDPSGSIQGLAHANINYVYQDTSSLTVKGGGGTNKYFVQATETTTTLDTGSGNDTVNVGEANLLQGIQSPLTVNGQGGTDTLNGNDQADTTAQFYGVSSTAFGILFGPVITYSGMATVALNGGRTASIYDIESTAAGTAYQVNAGTGNDVFAISASAQDCDNILGAVTLRGDGGTSSLTVNDQANTSSELYFIENTVIGMRLFGPGITYGGFKTVVVNGTQGQAIYVIYSTASGTSYTMNSAGAATFDVGNQSNSLGGILGPLTLTGAAGAGDTLTVNDQGTTVATTYTLAATAMARSRAATITYSNLSGVTVNGGSGTNVFNVEATATATFVNSGTGNDTVNLGYDNSLQEIQAPLTVTGQGGADTMTAHDRSNPGPGDYSVNAGILYIRPISMGITYSGLASVEVDGGGGGNTFNVYSTAAGTGYTLKGGTGGATFDVGSFGQSTLDGIQGALSVIGQGGTNTLYVNDQANPNPETYAITSTVLNVRPSSGITYSGFKTVVFNGSSGGNAIIVGSTAAGTSTTINGGAGYNEFVLGFPLDNLKGPTTLHAGGDPYSYVIFNDSEAAAGQTYTLTANTLTRSGIAPITWDTMNQVILYMGSGDDHVNVRAVAAATDESIAVATGDVVTVGSLAPALGGTVANILGELVVESGTDTASVIVDDSGDATPHPHAVFSAPAANPALYNLIGLAPAPIYFFLAPGSTGTVHAGSGGNTFTVANQPQGFNMNVDGGTGTNTLVGPNTSNTWNVTGHNSGTLGSVSFAKMQNLVGGTGVDVFQFASAGSVSSINGGGAPAGQGDWLDYSALTTPVTVNLATGSATNVNGGAAGAVTNIQNVFGGSGGSTLIGDAQGNILLGGSGADTITGGTGSSLLIGDGSSGQITGGSASGGDILIGGSTSYDTDTSANITALMAILAEWQSADSYNTRFTEINTGTIPGGYSLNFGTTVNDDGAANVLTGAASGLALDWFFAGTLDTTINLVPGEHLNNT